MKNSFSLTRDLRTTPASTTEVSRHHVGVARHALPVSLHSIPESPRTPRNSRFAGLPLFVVIFAWMIALIVAHLVAPGMQTFVRAHSVVMQPAPIAAPIDWSWFSALPTR
jgi:hypothetical protein